MVYNGKHTPCVYSMSTIWAFDRYSLYCGEDCMKKFCESLREYARYIVDIEKKKNHY